MKTKLSPAMVFANSPLQLIKDIKSQTLSIGYPLKDFLTVGNKYGIEIDTDVYLSTYKMNLQRKFCWNLQKQREFIIAMLMEMDLGIIVAVVREYKKYQIIDGKQRLTTIKRFMDGQFAINIRGEEYFFEDLDAEAQHLINAAHTMRIQIYYEYDNNLITDEQKIIIFNKYNFMGEEQTEKHKAEIKKLYNKIM